MGASYVLRLFEFRNRNGLKELALDNVIF